MKTELHAAKTQCGKNAIAHMKEYHRAVDLALQLEILNALLLLTFASIRRGKSLSPYLFSRLEARFGEPTTEQIDAARLLI